MEAVLRAGIDLKQGGHITDANLERRSALADPSMHARVREVAARCNASADTHGGHHAVAALAVAVAGDARAGGGRPCAVIDRQLPRCADHGQPP